MSPLAPESFAPPRLDPVAAAASEIIGGPLGRHARSAGRTARSAWQPAAAVLVGLSSLTVALGFLQKAHCFTKGWSNPDQFWHACYTDLPVSSGLGHAMPYLSGAPHLDQPLVSGLMMWLIGRVVPDGSLLAQQQWYFALWAVLITVIVMALVVVTAASVPRAPWRAAPVALHPGVFSSRPAPGRSLSRVLRSSSRGPGLGRSARCHACFGRVVGLGAQQDHLGRSRHGAGHLGTHLSPGPARRHRPAGCALGQVGCLGTVGGNGTGHLVRGEPALYRHQRGCPAFGLSQLVAGRAELRLARDGFGVDRARTRGSRHDVGHSGLAGGPGAGRVVRSQHGAATDGRGGLPGDAGDRRRDR